MKNILTLEEFISESLNEAAIEIIDYSEVIDNFGKTKKTRKPEYIEMILKDPKNFTDDMSFLGKDRKVYYIDDLIGNEVKVGNSKFFVNESLDEKTDPDTGLSGSVHTVLGPKTDRLIISGGDVKKHQDAIVKAVKKHDAGSNIQYFAATNKCVGTVIMNKIDSIRKELRSIDSDLVAELKSQKK